MAGEPKFTGFVFARGGSKGLPGKNLRPLGGRPLIGRAVEVALACRWIQRVVVSTDDPSIAAAAKEAGAEAPFMRPAELAKDDSPELLAWQHALKTLAAMPEYGPVEYMVSIPAVAPLRQPQDVEACMQALIESGADMAFTVKEAEASPYFVMFTKDEQGFAHRLMGDEQVVFRRQDAPEVVQVVPVAYAARADYVLRTDNLFAGKLKPVPVPPERAVDIDTEMDFLWAEFLWNRQTAKGEANGG